MGDIETRSIWNDSRFLAWEIGKVDGTYPWNRLHRKNIGPEDNQGELSGPFDKCLEVIIKAKGVGYSPPMSTTWSHDVCHPGAPWLLDTFLQWPSPFFACGKAIRLPWQRTLGSALSLPSVNLGQYYKRIAFLSQDRMSSVWHLVGIFH